MERGKFLSSLTRALSSECLNLSSPIRKPPEPQTQ
jgi:hypothetical protein